MNFISLTGAANRFVDLLPNKEEVFVVFIVFKAIFFLFFSKKLYKKNITKDKYFLFLQNLDTLL